MITCIYQNDIIVSMRVYRGLHNIPIDHVTDILKSGESPPNDHNNTNYPGNDFKGENLLSSLGNGLSTGSGKSIAKAYAFFTPYTGYYFDNSVGKIERKLRFLQMGIYQFFAHSLNSLLFYIPATRGLEKISGKPEEVLEKIKELKEANKDLRANLIYRAKVEKNKDIDKKESWGQWSELLRLIGFGRMLFVNKSIKDIENAEVYIAKNKSLENKPNKLQLSLMYSVLLFQTYLTVGTLYGNEQETQNMSQDSVTISQKHEVSEDTQKRDASKLLKILKGGAIKHRSYRDKYLETVEKLENKKDKHQLNKDLIIWYEEQLKQGLISKDQELKTFFTLLKETNSESPNH